jgi:hypothetical protein
VHAFTLPTPKLHVKLFPMKYGIVELRDKGASPRLIRELLLTVDVSVSVDTIARFLAEMSGEKTVPRRAEQPGNRRSVFRRRIKDKAKLLQALSNRHLPHIRPLRGRKAQGHPSDYASAVRARGRSEQSLSQRAFELQLSNVEGFAGIVSTCNSWYASMFSLVR